MKTFTYIYIMLMCFAMFDNSQSLGQTINDNVMSNVFGITAEGGITFGITDYDNKMNSFAKASLEYYLPSSGKGNIGVRIFGQTGFVSGIHAPLNSGNPTDEFSTKMDLIGAGVLYTLSIGDYVYPWVSVGLSNIWYYPQNANGDQLPNYKAGTYKKQMIGYNGDVGLRMFVSKSISINVGAGMIMPSKDYLDDIEFGPHNDLVYTFSGGLTYCFGRESDTDNDGVSNQNDKCDNTPLGIEVDKNGCPLDSDRDGVPDYLDKCANTPLRTEVDAVGCPLDYDRDGVPDYLDKCSNTPAGAKVDDKGCPLDADGDGVADNLDRCPNTTSGVKVDENGCPLDSDGDGVRDGLDKCPNTPKGVEVDSEGCTLKKETVTIIKPGIIESLVLSGDTNFETNKAKLLPNAYAALENLLITMKEHPEYKWEIGGHTDAVGSNSYNLKLSKQRAQSVVDYLSGKGINRNNLKVVGYGEDSPIASNDNDEGKSMNRRVEIKLLSKGSK